MKKTKQILSIFLSVCMIFSCMVGMTVTASATVANGTLGDNLNWTLNDEGVLTISGSGAMKDYNYDEPYNTWKNDLYYDIKSVVISNGVTSIGMESFAYLGITSVTIPSSVTTIGDRAFQSCADLTSITLPDSITSIGEGAFNSCNKLSTVNIPANVTAIDSMTFASCALTSITIPAGVTSLGNSAFWCCSALTTVTFVRPSVTRGLSVGSGAFDDCTATIAFSGSGTSTLYDGSAEITEGTALNTLDGDSYPDDPTTKKLTWKAPHDHSFTYSATGATITATCSADGCTLTDRKTTLTIVAPTLTTYGGTGDATATLTGLDDFNTATGKSIAATDIKYVGRDGTTYTESATAPTNAGKYTAKITVEQKTASVEYTIAAPTYGITVSGGTAKVDDAVVTEAKEGDEVTITATVPEGKAFDKWTTTDVDGLNESTTNPTTFTMPAKAVTVTANFKKVYTVSVKNDGHGTATASLTSGSEGTEVTLTATPATGYKFKEWSVISGGVTIANNKFTIGTENVEIKAIFEAKPAETYSVTVVGGTSDKATAEAGETVTITATVPDGKEFVNWTTSDVEGLNGSTAATTTFTMPAKAVTVTANFKDKSSGGGGYTPVIPSYTPTTTTTPTTTNTGNLENTTDEKKNDNGASLESSNDELNKAVLTDADRAAMAKGENIQVYLEVEEKKPTKAEQQKAEEALAEIDGNAEIAMYMDMNLFKKVGSNAPVQIHEVNGKVKVGFKVPGEFISSDPDVQRTFYIGHIKDDGTVEIIKCEFDPETGIATFLTDSFSCYFLMFEDAPATAGTSVEETDDDNDTDTDTGDDFDELTDDSDDDSDDDDDDDSDNDDDAEDTNGIISDDDSDDADDDHSVDNAVDDGNPHTGVSAGFGLLAVCALTAGAALALKKRKK